MRFIVSVSFVECLARRRADGSLSSFQVFGIPGEIAFVAITDERRLGETVILAGVNNQFGGNIQILECLIHLFAADDGNIEIFFAPMKRVGVLIWSA
jgi:hypothetical protein